MMNPLFTRRQLRNNVKYIAAALIIVFIIWRLLSPSQDFDKDGIVFGNFDNEQSIRKHDKWIVITTINKPTESIKTLTKIPGWKIVVVADRKTPKDWRLDGVVLLDVKSQKRLYYTVTSMLPYDSYTRKILGYLYAIEHGAKFIYETDDDNSPQDLLKSFQFLPKVKSLVLQSKNATENPYVHFGQSTLWPRGYPLENLAQETSHSYKLCDIPTPAIQQGLVDGDPDVDAIFRMTRKHEGSQLKLTFDGTAPPLVLPSETYAPFNSQNTLFSYDAFWSLVLPTSVTFRSCDIYRSYFAQRLLSLTGHSVGFYPPNCVQKRNLHSNLLDAIDEKDMYTNMGRLVTMLQKWKCTRMHFFDCVADLAMKMVDSGFWQKRDFDLINDWLSDLASVGYMPPVMRGSTHLCGKNDFDVVFYGSERVITEEQELITGNNGIEDIEEHLQKVCKSNINLKIFNEIGSLRSEILLVISIGKNTDLIPIIEAWYRPYFPNILYCGNKLKSQKIVHKWQVSYIGLDEPNSVICVNTAIDMNYRVSGYMHVTDNILLNPRSVSKSNHHMTNMWMTRDFYVYEPKLLAACEKKTIKCQSINKKEFSKVIQTIADVDFGQKYVGRVGTCFKKIPSDPSIQESALYLEDVIFYIPSRMTKTYQELVRPLISSSLISKFHTFVLLMLECLELAPDYIEFLPFQIQKPDTTFSSDYIFPYSFQDLEEKDSKQTVHFCENLNLRK